MKFNQICGGALVAVLSAAAGDRACAADTAKATVTVDGQTFTYTGGSCVKNGAGLVVNFGAPGPAREDYFGVSIEKVPGHFENAVVSFVKAGKRYSILNASGEATSSGASFAGLLMRGGTAQGSFTC
jgi:hypothetical protein